MDILDEEIANIVRDWGNAVTLQEQEIIELQKVTTEINGVMKAIEEISNNIATLNELNDQNATALEQAKTGSEQIVSASAQAKSNAGESKMAADLIQNTVGRMNELVEELAVAADELQRG